MDLFSGGFPDMPGLGPLILSIKLGLISTGILILFGTPLAFWLSRTRSHAKTLIEATVALPIVLPPTVLGFYLLILLGPNGLVGGSWLELTGSTLTFSFAGLVVGSVLYSMPFVIQPLQNAFENVGRGFVEAAATLGARPLDVFFSVILPLSARGFLTATIMGFAHTLGEFGVVLMVGGNMPGQTRVISIAIYDHVEALEYTQAHVLAGILLAFSFCCMFALYFINRRWRHEH